VVILRTFLGLLAGFVTMVFLVMAPTALLARFAPGWVGEEGKPKPAYAFTNIGYSFLAAAAGGYVTSMAPSANPLVLVLALAIIVLAMSALSALQQRGKQPVWYQLTLVAIMPLGVFAGGLLRMRVLGIL
jgi:hypothetical protein